MLWGLCAGVALCVCPTTSFAQDESFEQQLDVAITAGDDSPVEAMSAIDRLSLPSGQGAERAQRLKLAAKGVIAARNGQDHEAKSFVDALMRKADAMPIARADAALIEANLDSNAARTEQSFAEARIAFDGYEEFCSRHDPACNFRNWFQAADLLEAGALYHGNPGLATSKAQAMLSIATESGDLSRQAVATAVLALLADRDSETDRATRLIGDARRLADAQGTSSARVRIGILDAIIHARRNELDAARQAYETALATAEEAHLRRAATLIRTNVGDIYIRLGQPAHALELMRPALSDARARGNFDTERLLLHNTTLAEIAVGDTVHAKTDLERVLALWERTGAPGQRVQAFQELSAALTAAGDADGALALFKQEQALIFASGQEHDLLEKQIERQEAERRAHDFGRLAWAAAAISALFVAALVILAVHLLRRRNRRLLEQNVALRLHADFDALTGLPNRHSLDAIIARTGDAGVMGILYVIDLDHFKQINDRHGHAAGDAVLVEVARRLNGVVREGDLVVRWGGEEFLIFVTPASNAEPALLAKRVLAALAEQAVVFGELAIPISASIGYSRFPFAAESSALLWEQAFELVDAAMYHSKREGRNRATGISRVDAKHFEQLDALARTLESSAQDGSVTLAVTIGPQSQSLSAVS